jgi:putative protein-disulfide isomerase
MFSFQISFTFTKMKASAFHIRFKNYVLYGIIGCLCTSASFQTINNQQKMEILYIYDTLCGWCYGFGPVVTKIEQEYSNKADIQIISGGMVLGDRVQPVGKMAPYILNAIPRLEKITGVKIGEPYITQLKEGSYVTSSEKPAIALCVFKSFKDKQHISFAHKVQEQNFLYAKDLNVDATYSEVAATFGVDALLFEQRMKDSTYKIAAYAEFKDARTFPIQGYPALFLKKDNQYIKITEGYADYESIKKAFKHYGLTPNNE